VRSLAGLCVATLILASQVASHAASDPKPRVIGLLNLPDIYATAVLVMKTCGADTGVSVALYRSPSTRTTPATDAARSLSRRVTARRIVWSIETKPSRRELRAVAGQR
jgi:hypothetical protein